MKSRGEITFNQVRPLPRKSDSSSHTPLHDQSVRMGQINSYQDEDTAKDYNKHTVKGYLKNIFSLDPDNTDQFNEINTDPKKTDDRRAENPAQKGYNEYVKETVKRMGENEEKLNQLIQETYQPLLKISTVFPFDLVTDDIVIDIDKVTIIQRDILKAKWIQSMAINDITQTFISTDTFFAQLTLIDKEHKDTPFKVNFLKKSDAIRARRIIEGLMIACRHEIDLSKVEANTLSKKMEDLGRAQEGT